MRTFDLAALSRWTVGLDRSWGPASMLIGDTGAPGYPPYNIERTGETTIA